ncbi:MAG: NAD-dependent epimerase/dehydratase family protein [Anaerolineales bacterium]|nr:NAD-dependent epimerase/dehydratase family protein [Anaerolineales bacterium]
MYQILVLGATGFIGGHIAKKAQEVGWRVYGLRRNSSSVGHLQDLDITWKEGNLDDHSSLVKAMTGMDFVFHAAGFYPIDYDPKNIPQQIVFGSDQMKAVVKATREAKVKRLIYTSSVTTIGLPPENETRLADERDYYKPGSLPTNGYYEVKIAMENIALEAARVGYDIVILNPTTVFGPGDVHLSTGEILVMIARGKAKAVPSGMINIIDVRDVAAAHINAARIGKTGQRYILGGTNYSIPEAVGIIADIAEIKAPGFIIPAWILDLYIKLAGALPFIPHAPYHLTAYQHWQGYNTDKAKRELNLQGRFLEETARDSLRWFSQHGML